jgi:hypothetical protein
VIDFGTYKWDKALELISMRLDPGMGGKWSYEREACLEERPTLYFGGGHWRGRLIAEIRSDLDRPWRGVQIFNPSEEWTPEKTKIVEHGVALLCRMESNDDRPI